MVLQCIPGCLFQNQGSCTISHKEVEPESLALVITLFKTKFIKSCNDFNIGDGAKFCKDCFSVLSLEVGDGSYSLQ
jgi:hypothetical protein